MPPAPSDTPPMCSNVGCEVATTGSCAEGHEPPSSCPFYGRALPDEMTTEDDDNRETSPEGTSGAEEVPLPLGEMLTSEEVDLFLRRRAATVVSIVGDRACGKTTLICALYDRFLRGSFGGYHFSGSRTLRALEKRSHYSRLESRLRLPDTPHTSLGEGLRFFHFAVSPLAEARRTDLMLSDRAGEFYSHVRNNAELVTELVEVLKTRLLVMLLDGARIAGIGQHAGAMQDLRQLLRIFLDSGTLGCTATVQVVITKVDLLREHPDKTFIDAAVKEFHERLRSDFAARLGELSFCEVAARDPTGVLSPGFGIEAVFKEWVLPPPLTARRSPQEAELSGRLTTEFDRLLLRTPLGTPP